MATEPQDIANETGILYEIALSIGSSLDLKTMLRASISKMLRGLNCKSAVVYRAEKLADESLEWYAQFALPKNAAADAHITQLIDNLSLPSQYAELINFTANLAQQLPIDETERCYLFVLQDFGLLILRKPGAAFSTNLQSSLTKMMPKLAQACRACLHEQYLREQVVAAQAASVAKSNFLARMSHEIRTPLNGVLGMLGLVLDTRLNTDQKEKLELAELSASSLLAIINNILDLSQVEAGKFVCFPQPTDLFDLIGSSIKALAPTAWQKSLELDYVIASDVPQYVEIDADRFRQVLNNLVGNGIKFTTQGKVQITVSVEDKSTPSPMLRIVVADDGIGINPEKLDTIFQPFEQADGNKNRQYEGTGLGLAITREIIDAMSGKISVDSELDKGSRFNIALPLVLDDKQTAAQSALPRCDAVVFLLTDHTSQHWQTLSTLLASLNVRFIKISTAHFLQYCATKQAQPMLIFVDNRYIPNKEQCAELVALLDGYTKTKLVEVFAHKDTFKPLYAKDLDNVTALRQPIGLSDLRAQLEVCNTFLHGYDHFDKGAFATSSSLSLLIVDDNEINLTIATEQLKNLGHQTMVAQSGEQALQLVTEHKFDAVFMDVMMPVMDGYETTQRIRQLEHEQQRPPLPIIAMTANAMKNDRQECLNAGMDGYVSKPAALAHLRQELANVIANHNAK